MRSRFAVVLTSMTLLVLAVVANLALGDQGTTAPTPTPTTAAEPPCTPLKSIYHRHHWRDPSPLNGREPCAGNRRKIKADFFLYRHYRKIAPYRCHRGSEGYYAIPCYIISCESHFNWWAMNPSGASYIYQLLGWGAPPPNSFRNRVRNHEIAASLSLSNWVCA